MVFIKGPKQGLIHILRWNVILFALMFMRGTWLKHNHKKVTDALLTALLRSTRGRLKYSSQIKKLSSTKYKKSRNQVDEKITWGLGGWFLYIH